MKAGVKGLLGGLGVAIPVSYVLHRRWPYYHGLQPSLKAFGVILVAVPSFVISAERAALAYERAQWTGVGEDELKLLEAREQSRRKAMNIKEKATDLAARHPFSLISGTWAASMLGIYAWVSRDPLATPLQKITQTRVWAQGITLGIVLTAAILTHGKSDKQTTPYDHSWKDILDREEEEEKERLKESKA